MSISYINQIARVGQSLYEAVVDICSGLITRLGRHEILETDRARRLTIVQFGDYAEAFWRFANGAAEAYYAQRYTVDFVASLATEKSWNLYR